MTKYRLYIDEVGNSDLNASDDPNHRYLNLTGVIVDLDYIASTLHPEMEQLKQQFFGSHPDDPIIFHRRELVRRERPFERLNDPAVRSEFDTALLGCLQHWMYHVVSVTIDKLEHRERYNHEWRFHPYHYCMEVLLERYVMTLQRRDSVGDVMIEARGKKDDTPLGEAFTRLYENGTAYILSATFQERLTSKVVKMAQKTNNIAGLQLADLLAYPSNKAILRTYRNAALTDDFSTKVVTILETEKYLRKWDSNIRGWGQKWLP